MSESQIAAHKYVSAILIVDITEERVRHGDILAPHWFTMGWFEALEAIDKASS